MVSGICAQNGITLYIISTSICCVIIVSSFLAQLTREIEAQATDNFVYLPLITNPLDVSGTWTGILIQPSESFAFELSLVQKDNSIQAVSKIRDYLNYQAIMNATGLVSGKNIIINGGSWCLKTSEISYTKETGIAELKGNWRGSCGPGTVSVQNNDQMHLFALLQRRVLLAS